MAENENLKVSDLEGRPADAKPVDYAFWEVPGAAFKVIYSLPLFHEIDFVVNEGYRKIPHGGIEEGGLLFGMLEKETVRIEAYRPIVCEHVSGPSFVLSDRDLTNLEIQIMSAASDPDLEKLQPVGWFLAHTRGNLSLTDLEAAQFDRLFPEVFKLTVLIKPERFQPTRFGFLVRDGNREMPRDATNSAIILPLPGRTSKQSNALIPSIPAPTPSVNARRLTDGGEPAKGAAPEEARPPRRRSTPDRQRPATPATPSMQSIWKIPPEEELPEEPNEPQLLHSDGARSVEKASAKEAPPDEFVEPEPLTEAQRAARKQLARDRARAMNEGMPPPAETVAEAPPPVMPSPPAKSSPLPQAPAFSTPKPLPERRVNQQVYQQIEEFKTRSAEPIINGRSLNILALAALLGCLVGYIAYIQLPAPVIALQVQGHAQTVTVSWPPDETRNSIYSAVRVNNGAPVPLSADEKIAGQVELTTSGDVKVEVISRNWMRDSRGIVHYLRSGNGGLPSDSR